VVNQSPKSFGVLALQGGFLEHIRVLRALGVAAREVRLPEDLNGLIGLIIPGGESTAIVRLADQYGLRQAITEAVTRDMAVWGTCSGMIALARELTDPRPRPFGLLDIKVSRNWYGRQVDSFEVDLDIRGLEGASFPGVFIRAPAIITVGPEVERLASLADGSPVAVRSGRILATAFHPELTEDYRLHKLFLRLAGQGQNQKRPEYIAES
jgi:5'-phosphate synthase pdxT subunit